jgi:hypothetical protein
VPPVKLIVEEPGFAVTVPPQVLESMPTIVMLDGMLSTQDAFVNGNEFGLNIVIRKMLVPPASMRIGVNVLFISAGKDI